MSKFWTVWFDFLKTKSEPNFGFPHISSAESLKCDQEALAI